MNTNIYFTVEGKEVSSIGKGILAFIGLTKTDTVKDVEAMYGYILIKLKHKSN